MEALDVFAQALAVARINPHLDDNATGFPLPVALVPLTPRCGLWAHSCAS